MESHEHEYKIPFCERWESEDFAHRPRVDQDRYIANEILRVQSEEASLLKAILTCGFPLVEATALEMLSAGYQDPDIADVRTVFLRLVSPSAVKYTDPDTGIKTDAAFPPNTDPQGRRLDSKKAGKVLVAKVGNVGAGTASSDDIVKLVQGSSEHRKSAEMAGRNLYITREITARGSALSLRDSLLILRQWGYGIAPSVFTFKQPDKQTAKRVHFCNWLVEEITEEEYRG